MIALVLGMYLCRKVTQARVRQYQAENPPKRTRWLLPTHQ